VLFLPLHCCRLCRRAVPLQRVPLSLQLLSGSSLSARWPAWRRPRRQSQRVSVFKDGLRLMCAVLLWQHRCKCAVRDSSVICVPPHRLNWIGRPGAASSPSCKYHSRGRVEHHLNPLLCKLPHNLPVKLSLKCCPLLCLLCLSHPLFVAMFPSCLGLIFTAQGVTCMVVCVTLCCCNNCRVEGLLRGQRG
jgi:hypothetical protein